jgi:hypothetical protein
MLLFRAAFQFGVKMKDGRKAKNVIAKKQKLGQQLKKIQEVLNRTFLCMKKDHFNFWVWLYSF